VLGGSGEGELEWEDELEAEGEQEWEDEDEAFLGALGGIARGIGSMFGGPGDSEGEWEGEEELEDEGEEFFRRIGGWLRKAPRSCASSPRPPDRWSPPPSAARPPGRRPGPRSAEYRLGRDIAPSPHGTEPPRNPGGSTTSVPARSDLSRL
jgi:hypothetical protein